MAAAVHDADSVLQVAQAVDQSFHHHVALVNLLLDQTSSSASHISLKIATESTYSAQLIPSLAQLVHCLLFT